jgi:hypothetical protein
VRTIHANLTAEQLKNLYTPAYKIVLSKTGQTPVTITEDDIIEIKTHNEQPWSQSIEIVVDNSAGTFTSANYKGWKLTPSYGMDIPGDTKRYSDCAPLLITRQYRSDSPAGLSITFKAVGAFEMMAEDRASAAYSPDDTDTKTIKTLLTAIFGATLACYNHCKAYTVVYDSEDAVIDSYIPKSAFRIYRRGSRFGAAKRLLDKTGCVARWGSDGQIHVFVPTTTGTTYDMEIKLDVAGYQDFWSKVDHSDIVIPNYIQVDSQPDDTPVYTGYASLGYDADSEKRDYFYIKAASAAQCTAVAEGLLKKYQMNAQSGSLDCPMIVNLEVFDYIKVTSSRQSDTLVGNIGSLTRKVNLRERTYSISFSFGGWFSARGQMNDLEDYTESGFDFERLSVKDLYAEHIQTDSLDIVWIDSGGNIDLTQIGDTLDNLPDGATYGKVKSVHLDEGNLVMDATIVWAAGYDPTDKFDLGSNDLDDIPEGTSYQKTLATDLSAGHLKLTSATAVSGKWYSASGVVIDADHGILIYGTNKALVTRATVEGTDQCYVGSDGKFYAGAGAVYLSADGLLIDCSSVSSYFRFKYSSTIVSLYFNGTSIITAAPFKCGDLTAEDIHANGPISSDDNISATFDISAGGMVEAMDIIGYDSVRVPTLLSATATEGSITYWSDGSRFDWYADGAWHGVDEN